MKPTFWEWVEIIALAVIVCCGGGALGVIIVALTE